MMTCNFSFSAFLLLLLLRVVLAAAESESAVEVGTTVDRAKVSTELAKAQQELETLRQQQELAKARQEIASLRQKLADTPQESSRQTEHVEPQPAPNAGGLRGADATEVLRNTEDRTLVLRSGQLPPPDADVPVNYREAALRLRERREQQTTQRNNGEPPSLEKREQPLFPKDGKVTSLEERRRQHKEIIAKRQEEMKRRQEMRQQHGGEGTVDMSQRLSPSLKNDPDLRGRIQERTRSRIAELQQKRQQQQQQQKRVPRRFEPKDAPVEPNEPPNETPVSLETTPAKSLKPERPASDALLVTDDTILKTLENNWDLVLVAVLGFFVWYGPRLLDVSKKLCTRSKARHVL